MSMPVRRGGVSLNAVLMPCLSELNCRWLEESGRVFEDGSDREECYLRFAEVSSRIGMSKLLGACRPEQGWPEGELPREIGEWALDECGRVLLLAQAAQLPVDRLAELAEGCYFQGETRERQGVVRSLGFLPDGDRFLQIGLDAARTHVQPLFEALACENAFPAEAFPDTAFNHLVLKALFTEVRLPRIIGLASRVTPELQRMVRDYVDERRAAGRLIPPDVALIILEKEPAR